MHAALGDHLAGHDGVVDKNKVINHRKIELEQILDNDNMISPVNAAIYLLLDKQKDFETVFAALSENDKNQLREYPIWHLYKETK